MDLIWIITTDDAPGEGGKFIEAPCWRTPEAAREAFIETVRERDPSKQAALFTVDRDQIPMEPGHELRQLADLEYVVLTCQHLRTDFRDVRKRAELVRKEEELADLLATAAGLQAWISAAKKELGEA